MGCHYFVVYTKAVHTMFCPLDSSAIETVYYIYMYNNSSNVTVDGAFFFLSSFPPCLSSHPPNYFLHHDTFDQTLDHISLDLGLGLD